MSKVYLIYQSWGSCNDSIIAGAFLDEKQADDYIFEHRKPRVEDEKQHEKCKKCRRSDTKRYDDDNEYFDFRNKCNKAKIKKDRNGKYCENDLSSYYSIGSDDYWKEGIELLDVKNGEELKDNWDSTSKVLSQVITDMKNSVESVKKLDNALIELDKLLRR